MKDFFLSLCLCPSVSLSPSVCLHLSHQLPLPLSPPLHLQWFTVGIVDVDEGEEALSPSLLTSPPSLPPSLLTCSGSLWGLWMLMRGEKLLLTGTLAPMKGRSRYGLGIPTPNTWGSKVKVRRSQVKT